MYKLLYHEGSENPADECQHHIDHPGDPVCLCCEFQICIS